MLKCLKLLSEGWLQITADFLQKLLFDDTMNGVTLISFIRVNFQLFCILISKVSSKPDPNDRRQVRAKAVF